MLSKTKNELSKEILKKSSRIGLEYFLRTEILPITHATHLQCLIKSAKNTNQKSFFSKSKLIAKEIFVHDKIQK